MLNTLRTLNMLNTLESPFVVTNRFERSQTWTTTRLGEGGEGPLRRVGRGRLWGEGSGEMRLES